MAKCIKLRRTKTEVCIGNMNKKIDIYARSLTTPLDPLASDVDYDETFTLVGNVWSMVQTPTGKIIFDSLGVEKIVTDIFYIRYIADLTSENWVIFKGNRYDIQSLQNIEENSLFQKLNCIIRGDETLAASKA